MKAALYARVSTKKNDFYANLLMVEWGLDKQPAKFRREVKAVLMELNPGTQLSLRNEPRLQVEIVPGGPEGVWAYFPVHRRRWIARGFTLKPSTRILLVLCLQMFHERRRTIRNPITGKTSDAVDHLRDHLGHTLLYLRSPKAKNECVDAAREWKERCKQ